MMDQGIVMMVVGTVLSFIPPACRASAGRPLFGAAAAGVVLRIAYPVPAHAPPMSRLLAEADEAMERDAMLRGLRAVTEAYDRA